jgi:cytosine/uracil/thiamine/allantoin permease
MQQLFPYLNATQIATIPLVINIVQFVTTIFSIPAFDHFGRRPLLVAGNFATATISFLIGLFFLLAFQA